MERLNEPVRPVWQSGSMHTLIIVAWPDGFMCANTRSSIFWEGGEWAHDSTPLDPPLDIIDRSVLYPNETHYIPESRSALLGNLSIRDMEGVGFRI